MLFFFLASFNDFFFLFIQFEYDILRYTHFLVCIPFMLPELTDTALLSTGNLRTFSGFIVWNIYFLFSLCSLLITIACLLPLSKLYNNFWVLCYKQFYYCQTSVWKVYIATSWYSLISSSVVSSLLISLPKTYLTPVTVFDFWSLHLFA